MSMDYELLAREAPDVTLSETMGEIVEQREREIELGIQAVDIRPIKGGFGVYGDGWAVHGKTPEEALRLFREAAERHEEIRRRAR